MGNQVKFLTGAQSVLNGMTSSALGTFYLTNDSHRLYVGTGDGAPALLNQAVKVYDKVSSLPATATANDFYYAKQENILCIYDPDSNPKWIQINPDTNTDTNIDAYVDSVGTAEQKVSANGIEISIPIKRVQHDRITNQKTPLADLTISFTISKDNIASVNGIEVGLAAISPSANKVTISTDGTGADSDKSITLVGTKSTSIGINNNKEIEISSVNTTYDLTAANNKITLTNSNNEKDDISLAGDSVITATAANNAISVTHKNYAGTKETATESVKSNTFNVVTGIETEKGHVVKYVESTIEVPEFEDSDTTINSVDLKLDTEGTLEIELTDSNNRKISDKLEKSFYYTVNGTTVYNQGNIEFYTKEEIEGLLKGLNAMTYKGTVGEGEDVDYKSLPASGVSIGDTFLITSLGTYAGRIADAGDLFIAKGGEESDESGTITGTIEWSYVPSGSDVDTQYKLSAENDAIILQNLTTSAKQKVNLAAGTALEVVTTGGENEDKTITFSHSDVETSSTSADNVAIGADRKFNVVDSITVNDQGHVTAVSNKQYVLPADNDTTSSFGITADNALCLTESSGKKDNVYVENENEYITIDNDVAEQKLIIGHKEYNTTGWYTVPTTGAPISEKTFSAVTALTRDSGGHITGATVSKFVLPDDKDTTYSLSGATEVKNNALTFTSTLTDSNNKKTTSILSVKSDNLKLDYANNVATINLEWGSF